MKARDILITLAVRFGGDWDLIMNAIRSKKYLKPEEVEEVAAQNLDAITIVDADYPEGFRNCFKPPICLFYRGNKALISDRSKLLSYIGSREASSYGLLMAREIAKGLSENGYTIVSGMARGIDGEALRAAIEEKGRAIAILGSGINRPFPESNRDLYERLCSEGLVLSEYPGDVEPHASHFPFRNRLIASCPKALIVGEAKQHSGTSITVGYALGALEDIGAVPYRAKEESLCNQLIKDGAALVESVSDALLLMNGRIEKA